MPRRRRHWSGRSGRERGRARRGGARKSSLRATDGAAPLFRESCCDPDAIDPTGVMRSNHPVAIAARGVARAPAFIGWGRATPLSRDLGGGTNDGPLRTADHRGFRGAGGPAHPAITIYASTSPVVSERERAEVAVKSAFDEAIEQVKASGASNRRARRARARHATAIIGRPAALGRPRPIDRDLRLARLQRGVRAAQPARRRVARRLALHAGPAAACAEPGPGGVRRAVSANEWTLWHATPTDRAAQMPTSIATLPKNADDAANREAGERRHAPRRRTRRPRRRARRTAAPTILDIYAKRVADAVRQELQVHDPDERVPLFVFAAEPTLSQFMERATQPPPGRRPCRARPTGSAHPRSMRPCASSSPRSTSARPRRPCTDSPRAAPGRVERDLAAIGRLAADGAVETLWFDFTTSVNGTLDRESGAIEFATAQRRGRDACSDGTHAGDLLPQLALLVIVEGRQGRHGSQRRPRRRRCGPDRRWRNSGTRWPDAEFAPARRGSPALATVAMRHPPSAHAGAGTPRSGRDHGDREPVTPTRSGSAPPWPASPRRSPRRPSG